MRGYNPDYEEVDLDRSVLSILSVSSMAFFDNNCKALLFKNFDTPADPDAAKLDFQTLVAGVPDSADKLKSIPVSGVRGMVNSGGKPTLFVIQPIINPQADATRAGYLLITKYLDKKTLETMFRDNGFKFTIEALTKSDKSGGAAEQIIENSLSRKGRVLGRRLIADYTESPEFWITASVKKESSAEVERKINFALLLLALLGLGFSFNNNRMLTLMSAYADQGPDDRSDKNTGETPAEAQISASQPGGVSQGAPAADNNSTEENNPGEPIITSIAATYVPKERAMTIEPTAIDRVCRSGEFCDNSNKEEFGVLAAKVYERFVCDCNKLCYRTLEDVAATLTPKDENFRRSIIKMARKTSDFAQKMGISTDNSMFVYYGALFSRIGLVSLPFEMRRPKWELSEKELVEYKKYPEYSRKIMESISTVRPAAAIPHTWKENWDGSGFPQGLKGEDIPLEGRIFAIVNDWNELTRMWQGRPLPGSREVEEHLRRRARTRLDPRLVEEFIKFQREIKEEPTSWARNLGCTKIEVKARKISPLRSRKTPAPASVQAAAGGAKPAVRALSISEKRSRKPQQNSTSRRPMRVMTRNSWKKL